MVNKTKDTTSDKPAEKIYKLYWIYDDGVHTDIMTEGYVGCTTKSVQSRFKSCSNTPYSGVEGTNTHTKRSAYDFIKSCKKPKAMEICRTKNEAISRTIHLAIRPEQDIGSNKFKGGRKIGVQRAIRCTSENGHIIDYNSIADAARDGFHMSRVQISLAHENAITRHDSLGKCSFTYLNPYPD